MPPSHLVFVDYEDAGILHVLFPINKCIKIQILYHETQIIIIKVHSHHLADKWQSAGNDASLFPVN